MRPPLRIPLGHTFNNRIGDSSLCRM